MNKPKIQLILIESGIVSLLLLGNDQESTNTEWRFLPWKRMEKQVFKLQKRIYQASQRGEVSVVRKLQKTLLNSWSAKCLAVRKVTQDNQGKKTAGIDGIKSLTPKQRLSLVEKLQLSNKSKPTRRIWIPKPGKKEQRPLGIPTMYDRALQALVKLAMEPEWEAVFEPNSYGFRPGRSAHDAIGAIYNSVSNKAKFALDADISQCFDKIDQSALLAKIGTFPKLRRQLKAWLKSGVIDGGRLMETNEGTPQGGVISPLLANIALHGLENRIKQAFPYMASDYRVTWYHQKGQIFMSPQLIRYADDFVILHENEGVVKECKRIVSDWLKGIGLELNDSKTQIVNTLDEYQGKKPGFNFLGFNIRQYRTGAYHAAKNTKGVNLGFKTLIKPSKEAISKHVNKLGKIIEEHKTAPQQAVISKLNPVIKGWSNYYSGVVSKETFNSVDNYLWQKLWAWAKYRCVDTPRQETFRKYWHRTSRRSGEFSTPNFSFILAIHTDTKIVRHAKIQNTRSPYDGDWTYWGKRLTSYCDIPARVSVLLKKQEGKCTECSLHFKFGDKMEVDHIHPKAAGGKDEYKNLQLLHKHCHDIKSRGDAEVLRFITEN
jgi:RNA-directed DNA polymerase